MWQLKFVPWTKRVSVLLMYFYNAFIVENTKVNSSKTNCHNRTLLQCVGNGGNKNILIATFLCHQSRNVWIPASNTAKCFSFENCTLASWVWRICAQYWDFQVSFLRLFSWKRNKSIFFGNINARVGSLSKLGISGQLGCNLYHGHRLVSELQQFSP